MKRLSSKQIKQVRLVARDIPNNDTDAETLLAAIRRVRVMRDQ